MNEEPQWESNKMIEELPTCFQTTEMAEEMSLMELNDMGEECGMTPEGKQSKEANEMSKQAKNQKRNEESFLLLKNLMKSAEVFLGGPLNPEWKQHHQILLDFFSQCPSRVFVEELIMMMLRLKESRMIGHQIQILILNKLDQILSQHWTLITPKNKSALYHICQYMLADDRFMQHEFGEQERNGARLLGRLIQCFYSFEDEENESFQWLCKIISKLANSGNGVRFLRAVRTLTIVLQVVKGEESKEQINEKSVWNHQKEAKIQSKKKKRLQRSFIQFKNTGFLKLAGIGFDLFKFCSNGMNWNDLETSMNVFRECMLLVQSILLFTQEGESDFAFRTIELPNKNMTQNASEEAKCWDFIRDYGCSESFLEIYEHYWDKPSFDHSLIALKVIHSLLSLSMSIFGPDRPHIVMNRYFNYLNRILMKLMAIGEKFKTLREEREELYEELISMLPASCRYVNENYFRQSSEFAGWMGEVAKYFEDYCLNGFQRYPHLFQYFSAFWTKVGFYLRFSSQVSQGHCEKIEEAIFQAHLHFSASIKLAICRTSLSQQLETLNTIVMISKGIAMMSYPRLASVLGMLKREFESYLDEKEVNPINLTMSVLILSAILKESGPVGLLEANFDSKLSMKSPGDLMERESEADTQDSLSNQPNILKMAQAISKAIRAIEKASLANDQIKNITLLAYSCFFKVYFVDFFLGVKRLEVVSLHSLVAFELGLSNNSELFLIFAKMVQMVFRYKSSLKIRKNTFKVLDFMEKNSKVLKEEEDFSKETVKIECQKFPMEAFSEFLLSHFADLNESLALSSKERRNFYRFLGKMASHFKKISEANSIFESFLSSFEFFLKREFENICQAKENSMPDCSLDRIEVYLSSLCGFLEGADDHELFPRFLAFEQKTKILENLKNCLISSDSTKRMDWGLAFWIFEFLLKPRPLSSFDVGFSHLILENILLIESIFKSKMALMNDCSQHELFYKEFIKPFSQFLMIFGLLLENPSINFQFLIDFEDSLSLMAIQGVFDMSKGIFMEHIENYQVLSRAFSHLFKTLVDANPLLLVYCQDGKSFLDFLLIPVRLVSSLDSHVSEASFAALKNFADFLIGAASKGKGRNSLRLSQFKLLMESNLSIFDWMTSKIVASLLFEDRTLSPTLTEALSSFFRLRIDHIDAILEEIPTKAMSLFDAAFMNKVKEKTDGQITAFKRTCLSNGVTPKGVEEFLRNLNFILGINAIL